MSAIYKLSIQGIRSFDSNDRETIEFGKPLTLIVGSNGSGKTTIIECLKYATTGDLPPNSKGGAFVHDPKITGEKDVRAQVKLAFVSANNVNMIVTRNIQLLAKKTSNTFKTLEGQLVAINKSGRTTLSSRAAELDVQVPLYMGVPRSILDYVIFCHQEDSLWPLSEPSNLKKRFDEIFQAMKFTKALDNLKVIRKDISVDIKLLKQSVEYLKVERERGRATKVNIASLEQKIADHMRLVESTDRELERITEQSDRLFKSNQEFQEVLSRLEGLRHSQKSIVDQIKRLKETTEIVEAPKAHLEGLLANFTAVIEDRKQQLKSVEESLAREQQRLGEAREKINNLSSRKGELIAKKARFEEIIALRNKTCNEISTSQNLNGEDVMQLLLEKLRLSEAVAQKNSLQNNAEKRRLEARCSEVEAARVKDEQQLSYCRSDHSKLMEELDSLRHSLKAKTATDDDLSEQRLSLAKFRTHLEDRQRSGDMERTIAQIQGKNEQIVVMENELENVQKEILRATRQSDLMARYSLSKKRLEELQSKLKESTNILADDTKAADWKLTPHSDLELAIKKVGLDLQGSLAVALSDVSDARKTVTEDKFMSSQWRNDKDLQSDALTVVELSIKRALPGDCSLDDYDEAFNETEESYKIALENLKMHRTTLEFNLKALEVAKVNNCCYLCQRDFEDKNEQSKLLKELERRTQTDFEKTLVEAVQEEKRYLDSLRKVEKDVMKRNDLVGSISRLDHKLNEVIKRLKTREEILAKKEERASAIKSDMNYFEGIVRPVVEKICLLKKQFHEEQKGERNLADEISIFSQGDRKLQTIEELQNTQLILNTDLKKLRKDIDLLQDEKEARSRETNNLINLIHERRFKLTELEKEAQENVGLQKRIIDCERSIDEMASTISSISGRVESHHSKISAARNELDDSLRKFEASEAKDRAECAGYRFSIERIERLDSEIEDYEMHNVGKLEECDGEIGLQQEVIKESTEKVEYLSNLLAAESKKIEDSRNEQRNLRLNLDLLDLQSQLHSVTEEIEHLDTRNAEAQRSSYQEESTRLRSLFEKFSADNAGRLGEIKQLQNQINALVNLLRTDYKNVDDKYQNEWLKLQTKTIVTDDIEVYLKLLDSAIMKYHSVKMQDINRIMDELWKRTYSGTDVDTIKIKSDETSSTTKAKSYNYRVVMYKQDAELDMRGRCSAGQKVLASIIIRLALSESFGTNCGVIALDEPTTNLDEENIESLAKSLNNIIELRRHQKNFQLIVITHDEKFLNYMGAADFTDHFYKVKRDDRQKSQIEWVSLKKVIV
ncbi:LAMI_0F02762g1_1 [Lachancea mirantina]|uniref:DNA repair protein RAD50 n=1 Tax=Lachancea mirantina TaxID=1230905 RepID=A0A1G4JWT8_9SACH|nr:LAMI_0F02762g1_1 [Lachancea mirantina]